MKAAGALPIKITWLVVHLQEGKGLELAHFLRQILCLDGKGAAVVLDGGLVVPQGVIASTCARIKHKEMLIADPCSVAKSTWAIGQDGTLCGLARQ